MKLSTNVAVSAILSCVAAWTITDAKYSIVRSGSAIAQGSFSDQLPALDLDPRSSLELAFKTEDSSAKVPHQVSLTLRDPASDLSFAYAAVLRGSKATIKIPHQKIPAALQNTPLELNLIVASFEGEPFEKTLSESFVVDKSGSYTKPSRLGALPEIYHIFKPLPQTVVAPAAFLFAFFAFSLGFGLLGGLVLCGANLGELPKAFSNSFIGHAGLLGSLVSFEAIFFLYYLGMSIFDVITFGALIAPVAIYTGSRALREVNRRRTAAK